VRGPALVACVVGWIVGCPHAVEGQATDSPELDAFLEGADVAAALYADRREAMADGFRRLGPDFPGMGVHWVQTGRIVSGVLRGDRPSVLCYVEMDGEPKLVGLAYTLPLGPDESPPEGPFGVDAWHDHSGEVSEESLLLNHPSSVTATEPGFRLSMVHVWLPLENDDGLLAQNNWRLPFLRAGMPPPRRPDSRAARGLSLAAAGVDYYKELLHWAVSGEANRSVIDAVLERRGLEARRRIAGIERPDTSDLAAMARIWEGLWEDLELLLDSESFARVRPLAMDD
jgi:hypothetical protein